MKDLWRLSVVCVLLVSSHVGSAQIWSHEIYDGTLRVRIDDIRGGAITDLLITAGEIARRNIVDNGDHTGRQIQVSMYDNVWGGGDPTCFPCTSPCAWPWNPVQAGSACQSESGGQVLEQTATRIVTEGNPRHWKHIWGWSRVTVRQTLELVAPYTLRMEHTFTNGESFGWSNNERHELPVAYLQLNFAQQAIAYQGPNPFTHDAVTVLPLSTNDVSTTEPWVGFRDNVGYVVALARPGKYGGWVVQSVGNANLMQAWTNLYLDPGQQGTVVTYLVGAPSLTEARNRIYALGP